MFRREDVCCINEEQIGTTHNYSFDRLRFCLSPFPTCSTRHHAGSMTFCAYRRRHFISASFIFPASPVGLGRHEVTPCICRKTIHEFPVRPSTFTVHKKRRFFRRKFAVKLLYLRWAAWKHFLSQVDQQPNAVHICWALLSVFVEGLQSVKPGKAITLSSNEFVMLVNTHPSDVEHMPVVDIRFHFDFLFHI